MRRPLAVYAPTRAPMAAASHLLRAGTRLLATFLGGIIILHPPATALLTQCCVVALTFHPAGYCRWAASTKSAPFQPGALCSPLACS